MNEQDRQPPLVVLFALSLWIIVLLLIIQFSVMARIRNAHDETQRMVMDDVMDLRTEIIKLRLAIEKHDSKPQWWEIKGENDHVESQN